MRIISKEKDYYDTASIYGIDKETIYSRETTVIEPNKKSYRSDDGYTLNKKFYKIEFCVIGFCGKMYPSIKATHEYRENETDRLEIKCFYDLESYIKFFSEDVFNTRRMYFSLDRVSFSNKKSLKEYFSKSFSFLENKFQEYNAPIFIHYVRNGKKIINPLLKEYEFFKIKEPTVAFQDIYSYISGVLGSVEKETLKISDKIKIQQRGFDPIYGFRKKPEKK